MEKLKRVPKKTTFISDDVPRVLSRAIFFNFTALDDLGAMSKREHDLKKNNRRKAKIVKRCFPLTPNHPRFMMSRFPSTVLRALSVGLKGRDRYSSETVICQLPETAWRIIIVLNNFTGAPVRRKTWLEAFMKDQK
jgi:hypothetical protein